MFWILDWSLYLKLPSKLYLTNISTEIPDERTLSVLKLKITKPYQKELEKAGTKLPAFQYEAAKLKAIAYKHAIGPYPCSSPETA